MRVFTCPRPKFWCDPVLFSPDGRYLACFKNPACQSVSSSLLYAWDTTEADDRELRGVEMWPLDGLAFTPDGEGVYCHRYGRVDRVDLSQGKWVEEPILPEFLTLAIAPGGGLALAATAEPAQDFGPDPRPGRLTLRAAKHVRGKWKKAWERELSFTEETGDSGFSHLLFSAGGTLVVWVHTTGASGSPLPQTEIHLLDAATGKVVSPTPAWHGHLPALPCKAVAGPTGVTLFLKSRKFYAADPRGRNHAVVRRANSTAKHFTGAAFSPDGRRLATVSRDTAVTVWDTTSWEAVRQYEWKVGPLRSVCFAPDGLRCAAGSETGQVVVWDLDD